MLKFKMIPKEPKFRSTLIKHFYKFLIISS